MNNNDFLDYEVPQVEIIEVEVEKGFAVQDGTYPNFDPTETPL